jgi:hypothetical protein
MTGRRRACRPAVRRAEGVADAPDPLVMRCPRRRTVAGILGQVRLRPRRPRAGSGQQIRSKLGEGGGEAAATASSVGGELAVEDDAPALVSLLVVARRGVGQGFLGVLVVGLRESADEGALVGG